MLNRNAQYYQWLLPYLEGGLDDARRAQMEARLRDDPALAAEAAHLRRTGDGLRAAARQPLPSSAQVPRDLWPRLRAQMEERAEPAPARPAHAWWLTGVGATAAATLALAMVWLPGWHAPEQTVSHTTPMTAPVAGPGRLSGPPTPVPPAVPPHAVPPLPAAAEPKPMTALNAAKAAASSKVAVLPPPAFPVTNRVSTDPFALSPAPAASQNGARKPIAVLGGALPKKLIAPMTPQTYDRMASGRATREGGGNAMPAPPTTVLAAPALLPSSPGQVQPALPPRVTMAPPAPALDQVQNGADTNGLVTGGQNKARFASPAPTVAGQAQTESQPKAQGNLFAMIPLTTRRSAPPLGQGVHQEKATAKRAAPASAMNNSFGAQAMAGGGFPGGGFGGNAQLGGLDTWQATLSSAVQAPLWGDTAGEQQATQALMAAKESGELDDLRARLEARRTQSPKDLVAGRMLAAVYEFGFSRQAALHERQRVANMEGAVGEDWYALAQAEERTGNSEAARAAYRRALESAVPPTPYHTGIARARS